jgi:hypothetical protein
MEPNAGGHLTGSEFDILVSGSNAADQDPSYTGLAAHLDRCAACRERFDRYRRQVEGLHHLQVEQGATVSDACPDKAKWFSLAAGVLEEGESAMLLDHAASCDACGTYLKEAVEDWNAVEMPPEALPALSPEFGARVAAQLRLQCASQQMARHVPKQEPEPMIIPTRTRPRMWRFRPMWGYIGAAAAALVAIITSTRVLQPDPGQLLARAYEAGRTGPVRFPGAAFTPQASVLRGQDPRKAVLAEAEAKILRASERQPKDPHWQQLRGRLDFLHRRYDDAIATLQPLAQQQNAASEVYTDLGMVYLARGLADANPSDYENAVEYLSQGLRKGPNNPVGLFNRALALEALFLWDRAELDWNNYLRIDGSSGWAREAREHLDFVRKKKPVAEESKELPADSG